MKQHLSFFHDARLRNIADRRLLAVVLMLAAGFSTESSLFSQSSGPYMFVSSVNTHSIKRFSAETGVYIDDFVAAESGGLNRPQEVIFGPDGHMYVTGFGNSQIKKYDRDTGAFLEDFSKNYTLSLPTKTTFHSDSLIYVSQWGSNEKVIRFDMITGDFVDEFTSRGVINGCGHAWDSEGNLYVASWGTDGFDGNVQKFNPAGVFERILIPTGTGGLLGPVNLWLTDGELFVVDWRRGNVLRFDVATGAFNGIFITGMVNTEGFTFDVNGFVYLCDWQLNRINRYNSDGAFVGIFASGGGMSSPNDVIFGPPQDPTSVEDPQDLAPQQFELTQNFPNPFNPVTSIDYTLPKASQVLLRVFNTLGEAVQTLVDEHQTAGTHSVSWQGQDANGLPLASGVYLYKIEAEGFASQVKKMLLVK